ncbi:hypothetical protein ASPACDRAFT_47993 [Aspergillus aculeatus ATCC 16872]|uniref:Uncharacterized protein n=1 Tax=Aspergillus aculeatus (strain ATCC 16872 / CBS 172.66 / WB 5094) TaxID=690307 RepID=A0A1L9WGF2_ASPA1|nr:uncharacterized protein ASPACDRAFT_47993 [Aspergillus aculeatus ATCC 16872]OJJ95249.1 hypothetical protein ASPACDRAFT_47993 [Aspergillus aculeatus ATCC 16872]
MNYFTPVFRCEVEGIAETQWLGSGMDAKMDMSDTPPNEVTGFRVRRSPRLVDRCLDVMVRISGSVPVFFMILAGLLTWALLGIRFGNLSVWIASISDVQAILCYVFDSFIMRQLLRQYSEQREAIVELRSRSHSHQRMLASIQRKLGQDGIRQLAEKCNAEPVEPIDYSLHSQGPLARGIMHSARAFGHVLSSLLFWQLYINDATSALMILVFAFLACLRERYADHSNTSLDAIFRLDSTLEMKLRCLTKEDLPNPMVVDPPPKENILQVVIFYYADIIGTLVGLVFLVLVIIAWAAVGPVLHYDSNWWLLIGTYAGLVGLFDSFVLRNVQSKMHQYIKSQMRMVLNADAALLTELFLATDDSAGSSAPRQSLSQAVSRQMDAVTSHVLMVMAGFLLTIGCVVASSAMKWSLTGQLISNVPPSIIETFFMLILINGQNDAEASVHRDLDDLYHHRQRLLSFTQLTKELLEVHGQSDTATMPAPEEYLLLAFVLSLDLNPCIVIPEPIRLRSLSSLTERNKLALQYLHTLNTHPFLRIEQRIERYYFTSGPHHGSQSNRPDQSNNLTAPNSKTDLLWHLVVPVYLRRIIDAPWRERQIEDQPHVPIEKDELYQYQRYRWLTKEAEQLAARYRKFRLPALINAAIEVAGGDASKCTKVLKCIEGQYNKALILSMNNGQEVVARLPNPNAGPRFYTTASEVATRHFVGIQSL